MFSYKQIIVTLILVVANLAYGSDISYDQQNIAPQTWQEVDLSYTHKINGKDYIEQAKLLRPTAWLKQYHLDKVGCLVEVHESDVGIDAIVKVIATKLSKLSFSSQSNQKSHPVIGTFLKYSDDVWSYIFSNGETIEATSNHPFYDVDKQQYIPIGEFQLNGDYLLTDNEVKVQLSSKTKHNKGVESVYNFEVYQAHNYYVSQDDATNGLLVHNPNGPGCTPLNLNLDSPFSKTGLLKQEDLDYIRNINPKMAFGNCSKVSCKVAYYLEYGAKDIQIDKFGLPRPATLEKLPEKSLLVNNLSPTRSYTYLNKYTIEHSLRLMDEYGANTHAILAFDGKNGQIGHMFNVTLGGDSSYFNILDGYSHSYFDEAINNPKKIIEKYKSLGEVVIFYDRPPNDEYSWLRNRW